MWQHLLKLNICTSSGRTPKYIPIDSTYTFTKRHIPERCRGIPGDSSKLETTQMCISSRWATIMHSTEYSTTMRTKKLQLCKTVSISPTDVKEKSDPKEYILYDSTYLSTQPCKINLCSSKSEQCLFLETGRVLPGNTHKGNIRVSLMLSLLHVKFHQTELRSHMINALFCKFILQQKISSPK